MVTSTENIDRKYTVENNAVTLKTGLILMVEGFSTYDLCCSISN